MVWCWDSEILATLKASYRTASYSQYWNWAGSEGRPNRSDRLIYRAQVAALFR